MPSSKRNQSPSLWLWSASRLRRGYVLLISMGLLGLLAMLGTTFVLLTRAEQSISTAYVDRVRARMIAFSGLEHAIGAVSGYDRIHPWSGQFWYAPLPAGGPPIQRSIGTAGVSAIGDGRMAEPDRGWGSDDWLYGELAKPVTGGTSVPPVGVTRVYGAAIPQPGRRITAIVPALPPATHVSLPMLDPVTLLPAVANVGGEFMGYSSDPASMRGTYISDPAGQNPGDFYALKIVDAASRIFINDTNRPNGTPNIGRLTRMLNTLGGELGLGGTVGASLMAARGGNDPEFAPTNPITDESDLLTRLVELGNPAANAIVNGTRDFITYQAWGDPNVIRIPFVGVSTLTPTESRAPINMNTAPKEVLVAALSGIAGSYEKRDPGGVTPTGADINLLEARTLADHIIACRYFYGADVTQPIGYPHSDWMHVAQDTIDTAPGFTTEEKELLKAAMNPNTTIKKWNPDIVLVDPTLGGRTDFTLFDKTDLTTHNTEFCFGSMGYYDVESVAIIAGANRNIIATATMRMTVKTYDVLRLTTQEQFEQHRVFNDGAYPTEAREEIAPAPYNTRMVSILTLPEFPLERPYNPASDIGAAPWGGVLPDAGGPARYDGQLVLNGWVNHRAMTESVLVGFADRKFDAVRPSGAVIRQRLDRMENPANSLLAGAVGSFYNTQMHPFGAYFDPHKFPGKYLEYPTFEMPGKGKGTVELWFKPACDLVGTSGWEDQYMYLLGNVRRVNDHYFMVRIRNRQLQVVISDAAGNGKFIGFPDFEEEIFVDDGSGPPPPIEEPPLEEPKVPVNIVLTHDLTTGLGPKSWLPHTWHHIEFNWNEPGGGLDGTAMLFVDGEQDGNGNGTKKIPAGMDFRPFGGGASMLVGNSAVPSGAHDPEAFPELGAYGTIDNVCFHPTVLHTGTFLSRSRYHDKSIRDNPALNYTTNDGAADTTGNHGIYRRRLREIMDQIDLRGPAQLLTLSCTHYHPPHEHSTGSHSGPAWTPGVGLGYALGHVSMAIERDLTQINFPYDNCAGVPTLEAPGRWITVNGAQDLLLITKMEIAEGSQVPHNVGPIVDDITLIYTFGPRILSLTQPAE